MQIERKMKHSSEFMFLYVNSVSALSFSYTNNEIMTLKSFFNSIFINTYEKLMLTNNEE